MRHSLRLLLAEWLLGLALRVVPAGDEATALARAARLYLDEVHPRPEAGDDPHVRGARPEDCPGCASVLAAARQWRRCS